MSKERILVIDDDDDLKGLLRYNLANEGYRVFLASTGEEGLGYAKKQRPDLILLDLMLPQIDGFEVCRLLKTAPETKSIPVLILSAKSSETDQVLGLELGGSDYLTKPFSVKVLLARIKNILRARLPEGDEKKTLVLGNFTLDKEAHRFSIRGRAVELTRYEFKILARLMESPGIVISRERLVSAVWGEGALVSFVAVNMHIAGLRRKLGKERARIETIRGMGYRFAEKARP